MIYLGIKDTRGKETKENNMLAMIPWSLQG